MPGGIMESTILLCIWRIWVYKYWPGLSVHRVSLYLQENIHDGSIVGSPVVTSERLPVSLWPGLLLFWNTPTFFFSRILFLLFLLGGGWASLLGSQ